MPEPIHILFIIDSFFGGTGGAEAVLGRIVRHLPRDRYRCSVITFKADVERQHAGELDCPFHVYPLERTYDAEAFRTALKLRRYIRTERVALVHTFFETSDLWAAPIAKLSGVPRLISSRRDMGILRLPKHRLFYRLLGSLFDQVQVVSNEVGAYAIREDGLDPRRVLTVYNGIEPHLFAPGAVPKVSRESLGIPNGGGSVPSQMILSVGNIRRVKGYDALLETAALVCRECPAAYFVVAGNPHEPATQDELLARRAELGLESKVLFLGKRTDIASLLATADIFFMPSRSEGLSNALLEAMASGLPAVATRVGGNPEVVEEGVSGYLADNEDARTMADRLIGLISHQERRVAMGQAGRAIIEAKFTLKAMVDRMTKAYDALLSR